MGLAKVRLISQVLGIKGLVLFTFRRFGVYTPQSKALFKLFDWAVKSGSSIVREDRLIQVQWKSNSKIFPVYLRPFSSDPQVFKQILLDQELLPAVCYFKESEITPRRMIDGGGNIGLATLFMSSFFPDLKSLILEPHAGNAEVLKKNLSSASIFLDQRALWSEEGWVYPLDVSTEWGFSVGNGTNQASYNSIPAVTLSGLLERYQEEGVDYVKLDIEGAEEVVFTQDDRFVELLRSVPCISVEPHSESFKVSFPAYLKNLGFKVVQEGELIYGFRYQ